MFSYKAWERGRRSRKQGLDYKFYIGEKKLLFVTRIDELLNCWRFEKYYERLDGITIHQSLARGEGPVVRHLCSDGRCINPLHLLRGTDLENARDEIEVRDFEIKVFEEILGDYSMEGEDKHLIHLTLLPKVSIKLSDERGIRSLRDTNNYVREYFRRDYVRRLIEGRKFEKEEFKFNIATFSMLTDRDDIAIVTLPGK